MTTTHATIRQLVRIGDVVTLRRGAPATYRVIDLDNQRDAGWPIVCALLRPLATADGRLDHACFYLLDDGMATISGPHGWQPVTITRSTPAFSQLPMFAGLETRS